MKVLIQGREFEVEPSGDTITVEGQAYSLRIMQRGNLATVYVDEKPFNIQLPENLPEEGPLRLLVDAKEYDVEIKGRAGPAKAKTRPATRKPQAEGVAGAIVSQMTGRVTRVNVTPGTIVQPGEILLIVEAMKMENEIASPISGVVKQVAVAAGARVSEGDLLVLLEVAEKQE